MAKKWSRSPKHLLRLSCIQHVTRDWRPGAFVEFGPGTGDATARFLERGFHGTCYDLGDRNRQILRDNLASFGSSLKVVDDPHAIPPAAFDYLLAFEVLEHIEDDRTALAAWSQHLKGGGKVLLSVPAHMSKFSNEDKAAGHYRRYERAELRSLLESAGFEDIKIFNYGFPLGNVTRTVGNWLHSYASDARSQHERTIASGTERISTTNRLAFLFNPVTMFPFTTAQKVFFQAELGDGFVAIGSKP